MEDDYDDRAAKLIARLKASGLTNLRIAQALGRAQPAASRLLNGQRSLKADEIAPLEKLLAAHEHANKQQRLVAMFTDPDIAAEVAHDDYLPIEVLPTYAGAGGGGTGDGPPETALVPRRLIEDELRGHALDFMLVNIRGDSMEPDFRHGDQLLVDRRDRSPTQPGPFALRFEDSYVVKNVERTREGVRVFSSNPKYTADMLASGDIDMEIIGRPVWFGRRL